MLVYDLHDAFNISHHFVIPEPQHLEALRLNETVARDVILIVRMLAAVNLDAQSRIEAGEIENMAAQRKLAAEFETGLLLSQLLPEQSLSIGHVTS